MPPPRQPLILPTNAAIRSINSADTALRVASSGVLHRNHARRKTDDPSMTAEDHHKAIVADHDQSAGTGKVPTCETSPVGHQFPAARAAASVFID